jgi:hypothetical protein
MFKQALGPGRFLCVSIDCLRTQDDLKTGAGGDGTAYALDHPIIVPKAGLLGGACGAA